LSANAYVFENGHLYTSASTDLTVRMRAFGMILLTLNKQEFSMSGSCSKRKYSVAIVKPGGQYKIAAKQVPLIAVILNPLHHHFAALRSIESSAPSRAPRKAFVSLDRALQAAFRGKLSVTQAHRLFEKIVTIAMKYVAPSPAIDERVTKALRLLNAGGGTKSMTKLSKAVGLSYFRLSHLFTDSIGISLRNYLLWQKMHKIPFLHSGGASLALIAKKTGFVDAAHLAHTFREVFGAPPSYFLSGDSVRLLSWLDAGKKSNRALSR
jgi:AraC family transcriptional regulator of arabinose operon